MVTCDLIQELENLARMCHTPSTTYIHHSLITLHNINIIKPNIPSSPILSSRFGSTMMIYYFTLPPPNIG